MMLQRHQLVFIKNNAYFSIQSCHRDKDILDKQVVKWFRRGLPCVSTRQSTDDGFVNLGLPLFVNNEKHRIALMVKTSSILSHQPLPQLIDMQGFFFNFYGIEGIDTVVNIQQAIKISVYGSFLFQYLSGQFYVDENSDIDLLIDYQGCSVDKLNELIGLLNQVFNRTIDGEVRFHQLGDIAIKELLDLSTEKILCKHPVGVELLPRAKLYERYPSLCCV